MNAQIARVVYVHGRPAPHPNRMALLPRIGAELVPVDFWLPWAESPRPSRFRKWASLLGCAVGFPQRRQWDLILGDGPQHLPVVMKKLGLLRHDQKIVPYLADGTPYFLTSGYYGRAKTALLRRSFRAWDAYLCLGPMIAELTRRLLPPDRHRDVFVIQNFIRRERMRELEVLRPVLDAPRVLFAGGGMGYRSWYKGLDLMFEAFAAARQHVPELRWTIAGEWDDATREGLIGRDAETSAAVTWAGHQDKVAEIFCNHSLYLHCARGDAWPNAVMEAMAAGIPPLVSEWTGVRELVARVDARLVVPLCARSIADRIVWYFSLPRRERVELSERAREIALSECTEQEGARVFRSRVEELLAHFGLGHLELPRLEHRELAAAAV